MNPSTAPAGSVSTVSNYEWEIIKWRQAQDSHFGTVVWMDQLAFTVVPQGRLGFCVFGPLIDGSRYYPDVIAAQNFCLSVALTHLQRVHSYLTDHGSIRLHRTNRERIEQNERERNLAIVYGVIAAIGLTLALWGIYGWVSNIY